MIEQFVVKHYSEDERPTIKGNGFDGLEVGTDRDEAQGFVDFVNSYRPDITRFYDIRAWAEARNLIKGSDSFRQMTKLVEEIGELAQGIAKGNAHAIDDAIGDAVVVLTILAAQQGVMIEDCIELAWEQIKDRKGRMVDGVFIKEGD